MPNACENRLAITGPPGSVMELVRWLEGEDSRLDFERLVPMPPGLRGPAGNTLGASGLPLWREWANANWGVKWNAWSVVRQGYGRTGRVRYRLRTAYGPPSEFLDRVAERWRDVTITLTFDVELMGDGSGLWRDGERVELHDQVNW